MKQRKSLRITCLSALFMCTALANAELRIAPGDLVIGAAAADQSGASVASGDGTSLVVWTDNRANPYSAYAWSEYETSRDIYGVRIDESGTVLDAVPIAIAPARSIQNSPKVSWNGTHWLVVFESMDLSGTGFYYQESLEAVRVATTGEVLDPQPIKLFDLTPAGASYWDVASDGGNWVIANEGCSASGDIVAVRVSPDGVMLDGPTHTLVAGTYYMRSNIRLAYSDGVFLMTYDDGSFGVKAVRFDSALDLLDGGPLPLAVSALDALAGSDDGFYAVWNQQFPDFSVHVVGSRISVVGTLLDGGGVDFSGGEQPYAYAATDVSWDGMNWTITWATIDSTYVARAGNDGNVLGAGSVPVPDVKPGVTAGTGNGGVHLVWTDADGSTLDVAASQIMADNSTTESQILSVGTPTQLRPDVAGGPGGFMLVYASSTGEERRVVAQPFDVAGNPVTTEPVELGEGPLLGGPGTPNVAWNGTVYLVTWANAEGVVAQRLSPGGAKIDDTPFMVMPDCFGRADVASLGTDFLVTGRQFGINTQYVMPVAARVSGDGVVLDPTPLTLGISYLRTSPAVVALGDRWLVAWHRNATHDSPSASSRAAFVPAVGDPTAEFTVHSFFSTSGGNGIFELALASNGDLALLVQSQELSSGVETDLLCHTIDTNGAVGPQTNLTPWAGNQYRPRVAWDGQNFVVVYQDQVNRSAPWSLEQLDARSDLFGLRVDSNGTPVDPGGFTFTAFPTAETDPTVGAFGDSVFLAGAVMMNDGNHAAYRIAYDVVAAGGPVTAINASTIQGDVPLTVDFNTTGSTGDTLSWDFADGTTSNAATVSHTFVEPGEYPVSLTATDAAGRTTTQVRMIRATTPNQLPVATATADPPAGAIPLQVVFSAAGSYDPDGFIGNFEWEFSDGGSYWGSTAYHTFNQPGPQTATLYCYDARGGVGSTTVTVNQQGVNLPPSAQASADPTSGFGPLEVQFNGDSSFDQDGTIVAYEWDFGDGTAANSDQPNPSYTYGSSGSYVATLTVWDDDGDSDSDTVSINVAAAHRVEYGVNLSLGPVYIEHYEQGEQPVAPIVEEQVIDAYGRVAGEANVGFGVNKARVDLTGNNPNDPLNFEYGFATSRYWDALQFDDPELDGSTGYFDVTLYVSGAGYANLSDEFLMSPDTEFDAFWHAVINVTVDGVSGPSGPIQSVFYAGSWYKPLGSNTLTYTGDPLNTYQQTATIEFIYGQPIFMDTFLQVDTHFDNQLAQVGGTLDSVIDLGNSSYWGGISNLRDAQGNPVTSADYFSSSGIDYRVDMTPALEIPVPPAAVAQGGRYVAVTPEASVEPTAISVTSPDYPCMSMFVQDDGSLGTEPVFLMPSTWGTTTISAAEIVPDSTYNVQAVIDVDGEQVYSDLTTVYTWVWGDVDHNESASLADVFLIVKAFQGDFSNVSLELADLEPCIPNGDVNFADIQQGVLAFQGVSFEETGCSVPCQ